MRRLCSECPSLGCQGRRVNLLDLKAVGFICLLCHPLADVEELLSLRKVLVLEVELLRNKREQLIVEQLASRIFSSCAGQRVKALQMELA